MKGLDYTKTVLIGLLETDQTRTTVSFCFKCVFVLFLLPEKSVPEIISVFFLHTSLMFACVSHTFLTLFISVF